MGNKQTISSLVTGGEASAGPPLGPALGPIGVNILEVIEAINKKTSEFKGMKIPVTVSVDSDTKKWEIEVGIPSASALLLKEAGIQKGSGTSGTEWVASSDPNQFNPNMYIEISENNLLSKINGMESYEYEKREFPHPRSPDALTILAKYRGITIGKELAEAFCVIRTIN